MDNNMMFIGDVTIDNSVIFLLSLILIILLGNLTYALLRRFLDYKITLRNSKIVARITEYLIILLGLYYSIYYILGLDLTAILASLGIITIAIAFASQQIIQNIIAGMMISMERPIQIGDWIEIGGLPQTGINRVSDIKLMKTILKDRDGKIIYMPNSLLLSSKIINYTKAAFIEIPIQLLIPYNSDHEKIKSIILQVANESPKILPNVPKDEKSIVKKLFGLPHIQKLFEKKPNMSMLEPKVLISDISNSGITLIVRVWIREIDKRDEIVSSFLDSLLKEIKDENIELER